MKEHVLMYKRAMWAIVSIMMALSVGLWLFSFRFDANALEGENASVAYRLPSPAAVYIIGDTSVGSDIPFREEESETEDGAKIPVFVYRDNAEGYSAAVTKATEIMYQDDPVVKVVLASDWKAVQKDVYALLTRFGEGDAFFSGMIAVPYGTTLLFDLNGHVLDRGMNEKNAVGNDYATTPNGSVFDVQGTLLLTDGASQGTVTGGKATNGGGIRVSTGGKLYTYGGSISGNTASISGGGVYVMPCGVLKMFGGSISANASQVNGGGVGLDSAYFSMLGGEIEGNRAGNDYSYTDSGKGGGIHSVLTAAGSYIETKIYDENGDLQEAGVSAEIDIKGGSVSGNTAVNGGGIYYTDLSCNIRGGRIEGNTATAYNGTGGIYGENTLGLGGNVTISGNICNGSDGHANINLSDGESIRVIDDFDNAVIRISDIGIKVTGYDGYNSNSSGAAPYNIDKATGLPIDPNNFLSWADCDEFDGQYHAVRRSTSGDSEIYASKYYAKWNMYYITDKGGFGDKITDHRNDDALELENGYSLTYYFNDYVNESGGANKNAIGFKADIYIKTAAGVFDTAPVASDLGSKIYRLGYGSTASYVSATGNHWQIESSSYNGENFYLMAVYKAKSIEDDDVGFSVTFDPSKLTFEYVKVSGYSDIRKKDTFGFATVRVYLKREGFDDTKGLDDEANIGKFVELKSGYSNDFYVEETRGLHVSDKGTLTVSGRGNYCGSVKFSRDDNGVEYKLKPSAANYYFSAWKDGKKSYKNGEKAIYEYSGKDVVKDIDIEFIIGDLDRTGTALNGDPAHDLLDDYTQTISCRDGYFSDDRGLKRKIYRKDGSDWVLTDSAVSVGKYKMVIDEASFTNANCGCEHIFDTEIAASSPEGTTVYYEFEFDIVALVIDFDAIFSEDDHLPIINEDGDPLPINVYLKDVNGVSGKLGEHLRFAYFDSVLNENRVLNFAAANSAYIKNGKVNYVGTDETVGYIYYTGNPLDISLESLTIGLNGNDPFIGGDGYREDDFSYWKTDEDDNYTGWLHYYSYGNFDFRDYKEHIGSFYSGGLNLADVADITFSHRITYEDGSEEISSGTVVGRGNGEVTLVTTEVTVTFDGYADKDGNTVIGFSKDWAIVSACNAVKDTNGDPYKYTEEQNGEITFGAGNHTAPKPEYGSALLLELKDPKQTVTAFVVSYGDGKAELYEYDAEAPEHKGDKLTYGFSQYLNSLCAAGGIGEYVLTARPDEYVDPLTGLVYCGAVEEYMFTVTPRPIENVDEKILDIRVAYAVYTGNAVEPDITVIYDGYTLPEGSYRLSYSDNTSAGTATVTVEGTGVFSGTRSVNFVIEAANDNTWSNLYMADWWHTKFDATTNRVIAAAKYGYDKAVFDVMKAIEGKDDEKIDDRLMGFKLGAAGVIPGSVTQENSVAYLLNSLPSGQYALIARIEGTTDYNAAQTRYTFAVFATSYALPSLTLQTSGVGQNNVYTGYTLSITLENYNPAAMRIEADPRLERNGVTLYATNAGSYTVKFTLLDTENSAWSDGGEGIERTITWVVEKKKVAVPEAGSDSFLITGDTIVYIPEGFDAEIMEISGNEKTAAGRYDALITLKDPDNYEWAGEGYGAVITRSYEIIGAARIFLTVIGILGGVILLGGLIALMQYLLHRQRMKVFALASQSRETKSEGGNE